MRGWLRHRFGLTETGRGVTTAVAWRGAVTTFRADSDPAVDYGSTTWVLASQVYAGGVTVLHKTHLHAIGGATSRAAAQRRPGYLAWHDALGAVIRLGSLLGKSEAEVWDDIEWGVYTPMVSQS